MLIGGRGKAGGIKLAADDDEAERARRATSSAWTSAATSSARVWIEHASDIANEYYASVTARPLAKKPLVMFSVEGGMDIEEVAEKSPRS